MLKIKEEVNLKKLVKNYGFLNYTNLLGQNYYTKNNTVVYGANKEIEVFKLDEDNTELDVIYDLIKDGLVEKEEQCK